MNKRLAKLQKELDISDTHNMPSTDIILKNVYTISRNFPTFHVFQEVTL